MNGLTAWFKQLDATAGINLPYIYDPYDRARFLHGLLVTLELSAITVVACVLVGVVGAWMTTSRSVWARGIAQGYVQVFRNTPPLVQIYFFYGSCWVPGW